MADVDPYSQAQQYTPRTTDVVDAIFETKRVTEAALRANPLRNARVDDGLMVWRGNYAGQGGINDSYLWIGEISPIDGVLNRPQRGFFITRDDSKHARALWMYDPYAYSANPVNQPLRQLLSMHDADDRPIMVEGRTGGLAFPYGMIPLYPSRTDYYNVRVDGGTALKFLPILGSEVIRGGGQHLIYEGYGPMLGTKLKAFLHGHSTTGSAVGGSFGLHIRVSFDDGTPEWVSGRQDCAANGASASFFWDVDFAGQNKVGREVHVKVFAEILSGSDEWCYAFPLACYSHGE